MKEKDFQGWVVDVARRFGWKVWHVPTPMKPVGGNRFVPDSRGRGLSDLIMLRENPPKLILAEVKGDGGVLSDEQREFLRLARGVAAATDRVQVCLWRPGNETVIEAILRG